MKKVQRLIALILIVCMVPIAPVRAHPFTDVPEGCWFAESVDFVYDSGLMNGTDSTHFSPERDMNRAMVVTVLHRMAGSPSVSDTVPFTDVQSGSFYMEALKWAYHNGVVNGISATEFAPGASVNRSQLVTFFYRFAGYLGSDTSARADLSGYTDAAAVPAFARDPFAWAVAQGVITGVSATELSPAGTANRAQCATILCRVAKLVGFYELSLPTAKLTLLIGETARLEPTYTGSGTLTWKSSHEHIASVSQSGEITALSPGTAYITVMDGKKTATCKVVVTDTPILTVNITEATVNAGDTYQVNFTYTGDPAALTWHSTNEAAATVDGNGLVTAVAVGNASIIVTDGTTSQQCRIKVVQGPVLASEIVIRNTDGPFYDGVTRYKGDYVDLALCNKPNEADQNVLACSSNNDIVSIEPTDTMDGYCHHTLTFKSAGTATITLTSGDGAVSQSYTITVKDGYDFDPGDRLLTPEEFADYTTKVMCENGFTKSDCSGWLLLTLYPEELTFERAISSAYGYGHTWWSIGLRYCQIVYIGQNENGKYEFHACNG